MQFEKILYIKLYYNKLYNKSYIIYYNRIERKEGRVRIVPWPGNDSSGFR